MKKELVYLILQVLSLAIIASVNFSPPKFSGITTTTDALYVQQLPLGGIVNGIIPPLQSIDPGWHISDSQRTMKDLTCCEETKSVG